MSQFTSDQLASLFKEACLAEITALKPGNVHIFADGHGMVVQDFIRSADAASLPVSRDDVPVGKRIKLAVDATWQAVGCNTNLGIVLLAAPLMQAAYQNPVNIRDGLSDVLSNLDVQDAIDTYQAIQQASPAGLGELADHDVGKPPEITLLAAMQAAQAWDLIARQYSNNYLEVFELGVPAYKDALLQWGRPAWAVTALYLNLLASFPDTHITRKFGIDQALLVQNEAKSHLAAILELENPKLYQKALMDFDDSLKKRGLNPGTSADMTVASLLAYALTHLS